MQIYVGKYKIQRFSEKQYLATEKGLIQVKNK